jgi:hypothetical protein
MMIFYFEQSSRLQGPLWLHLLQNFIWSGLQMHLAFCLALCVAWPAAEVSTAVSV